MNFNPRINVKLMLKTSLDRFISEEKTVYIKRSRLSINLKDRPRFEPTTYDNPYHRPDALPTQLPGFSFKTKSMIFYMFYIYKINKLLFPRLKIQNN